MPHPPLSDDERYRAALYVRTLIEDGVETNAAYTQAREAARSGLLTDDGKLVDPEEG
jgi:hypothetical protein